MAQWFPRSAKGVSFFDEKEKNYVQNFLKSCKIADYLKALGVAEWESLFYRSVGLKMSEMAYLLLTRDEI